MCDENELIQLQRRIAIAKALVQRTALKIEEFEASVEEIYSFKERLIVFRRDGKGLPTRMDKSEELGEFLLT